MHDIDNEFAHAHIQVRTCASLMWFQDKWQVHAFRPRLDFPKIAASPRAFVCSLHVPPKTEGFGNMEWAARAADSGSAV